MTSDTRVFGFTPDIKMRSCYLDCASGSDLNMQIGWAGPADLSVESGAAQAEGSNATSGHSLFEGKTC